ncbi:MAG: CBS domain-containing protein [Solirubrobacteraceae bacterium]
MRAEVLTCGPDDDLATLARTMVTHGVHAAVLERGKDAEPVFVADLELVRAGLERADNARAGDLSREPAPSLPADAPFRQALARMAELDVAHVLVRDPASGAPCGVLSRASMSRPPRADSERHSRR